MKVEFIAEGFGTEVREYNRDFREVVQFIHRNIPMVYTPFALVEVKLDGVSYYFYPKYPFYDFIYALDQEFGFTSYFVDLRFDGLSDGDDFHVLYSDRYVSDSEYYDVDRDMMIELIDMFNAVNYEGREDLGQIAIVRVSFKDAKDFKEIYTETTRIYEGLVLSFIEQWLDSRKDERTNE